MTVCPGGTSQPKAGVPASVVVDQGYMQSLLPQPWSFLYQYLPYMHVLEIGNVGDFCSQDPPTYSLPDPLEFLSFVTGGNLGQALVVRTFFDNLVKSYLWYGLCECSAGSLTPHDSPLSDPGDLPALNPPTLTPPVVIPVCASDASGLHSFGAGTVGRNVDLLGTTGSGGAAVPHTINPSAQYVRVTYHRVAGVGATSAIAFTVRFWPPITPTNTFLPGGGTMESIFTTGPQTKYADWPVPVGATGYTVTMQSQVNDSTDQGEATVGEYCDGKPGETSSPCCPPDPVATGLLSQILQMVTLIQRQAVPFAYVQGSDHTGLEGSGSLSIADLIGVQARVTTIPDSYGREAGEPFTFFDLGVITFGTIDGYRLPIRLEEEFQLLTPPLAGLYTTVGYSLAPGVVVTLTELVREP